MLLFCARKMKNLLVAAPSFTLHFRSSLSPFSKFFINPPFSPSLPLISQLTYFPGSHVSPASLHHRSSFSAMASSPTDTPFKVFLNSQFFLGSFFFFLFFFFSSLECILFIFFMELLGLLKVCIFLIDLESISCY